MGIRNIKGKVKKRLKGRLLGKGGIVRKVIKYTILSHIIPVTASLLLPVVFLGLIGGILGSIYGRGRDADEQIHIGTTECQCGCIWVIDNTVDNSSGSIDVDNSTGTSTDGKPISSLKYLGTPELSVYSKKDNDDGAGNFNTVATSSGADATKNITCALPKKLQDAYGVKYGDWLYIEKVGVRQLQDLCGTAGRIDVYVGDTLQEQPELYDLSGSKLKAYLVERGKVKKGSQDGVKKPIVSEGTVTVPSYGHGTGSLTDTSIKLPKFKYPEKTMKVLDAFLPGALVSHKIYGTYVSVTIGQKIQESGWGITSAIKNNFYGIKADASWKGEKMKVVTSEENSDGEAHKIEAWFRVYPNINEGALAHGEFLTANDRYAKYGVFTAKSSHEQIRAIHKAGYATDNDYSDTVIDVMKTASLDWFDNYDNAIYYLKSRGLYNKYKDFANDVKAGKIYVNEKAKLDSLNDLSSDDSNLTGGINGNSGSNGSNGNSQGGHWLCTCSKPCKLCKCHDDEIPNNSDDNGVDSNGVGSAGSCGMATSVPGQASGLWGSTEQLKANINALNKSNAPLNVSNLGKLKDNLNNLVPLMGIQGVTKAKYKVDRYRCSSDGLGHIFYSQSSGLGVEPYLRKVYNDGSSATFGTSACGIYSTAMVLSTFERKWVNPVEVAIALQTYGVRHNKRIETTLMGGSGAALGSGLLAIIKEAGYNKSTMSASSISKSDVDRCIDAGGQVIYVTKDRQLTGGGHYVILRERLQNGNYVMGNSTRLNDNEFTFNKIQSGFKHTAIYVYPKDGYNKPWDKPDEPNKPETDNKPDVENKPSIPVSGDRDRLIAEAKKHLGKKYVFGASGPNTFDCSGLVQYCYKQIGIKLPRVSYQQAAGGVRISKANAKPGDIVSFKQNGSRVDHVGIYLGNNQIIHAPNERTVVKIQSLDGYWGRVVYGFHRYIND